MHTIENNPFRILGIISNASAKETNESETFILRYLDIGKSANLKFDITPPLRPLSRTSEIVKNAKRRIHDDFDKLTHSIFWFVNGTMVDKIALEKLSSEKNIEKATDSFRKGSRNFEISKSSYSSILNFSTLEIVSYSSHKDQERVKNAIKYKYQIIKDKLVFKELEKLITSNTDKINHKSFINQFIESTKVLLKELFPKKDQNKLLIDIFSEDKNILKEIERQIVSSLVKKINENIALFGAFFEIYSKKTDSVIVSSRSTIIKQAKKLITDTKSDLNKLKKIVGKDNYEFTNLINEVFKYVNVAVIICFNKEMDLLNNKIQNYNLNPYSGTFKYPSFKLYVDILEEAFKQISSINCPIKNTIDKNLQGIKKNHAEGQKRNREQSYSGGSSYGGRSSYGGGSSYGDDDGISGFFSWLFRIAIFFGGIFLFGSMVDSCNDSDNNYKPIPKKTNNYNLPSKYKTPTYYPSSRPANGFSPYDDCYGKGIYNNYTKCEIKFKNNTSYDIVLLLRDYANKNIVRNEYIRGYSEFNMTGIPYGKYYVQYVSGKSWSNEKPLNECKGNFLNNASYRSELYYSPINCLNYENAWEYTIISNRSNILSTSFGK